MRAKQVTDSGSGLAFIRRHIAERGCAPSARDIAAGLGLSGPSAASYHLDRLRQTGAIETTPGIARSIRVREVQA